MKYLILFLVLSFVFVSGFVAGKNLKIRERTFGWLRIDRRNERFRLEMNDALDLDALPDKYDYVILYVDPNAELPFRNQSNDLDEM